jgi:hypothetical protein
MGIGVSVFLMAAGAIMTFAVETDSSNGFNINNAGVILMVIGALGLIATALIWGPRTRRSSIVEQGPSGETRRVVREDLV